MTLAVRGTNTATRTSTPLTIALPAGVVTGDWLLAFASGGNSTPLMAGVGTGWIDLVPGQPMGTGNAWVGCRQLTTLDISTGSVQIGSTQNQGVYAGIVVYSGCAGFGTPGTVYKRSSTIATTLAPAAGTNGQYVAVIQCEKSTNNPGPSVAPTTAVVVQMFPNGAALPSVWAGSYTVSGSPADRTFTNPVSSGNGLGVQIPVLEAAPPPPVSGFTVWNGTTEQPVTLQGMWTGTDVQPLTLGGYEPTPPIPNFAFDFNDGLIPSQFNPRNGVTVIPAAAFQGAYGARLTPDGSSLTTLTLPPAQFPVGNPWVGFKMRFRLNTAPGAAQTYMNLFEIGNTVPIAPKSQFTCFFNAGTLTVDFNTGETQAIAPTPAVGGWHLIEVRVYYGATAYVAKIRYDNGPTYIFTSASNKTPSTANVLWIHYPDVAVDYQMDVDDIALVTAASDPGFF